MSKDDAAIVYITFPSIFAPPDTSNLYSGDVVPIPTSPPFFKVKSKLPVVTFC